mmetsp:Transcript_50406/g.141039  ORF Transcript_50406/g.141039 Transcript_50406/m.141039 type:complete len:207 (-) Transcript_50406:24-644(-)
MARSRRLCPLCGSRVALRPPLLPARSRAWQLHRNMDLEARTPRETSRRCITRACRKPPRNVRRTCGTARQGVSWSRTARLGRTRRSSEPKQSSDGQCDGRRRRLCSAQRRLRLWIREQLRCSRSGLRRPCLDALTRPCQATAATCLASSRTTSSAAPSPRATPERESCSLRRCNRAWSAEASSLRPKGLPTGGSRTNTARLQHRLP